MILEEKPNHVTAGEKKLLQKRIIEHGLMLLVQWNINSDFYCELVFDWIQFLVSFGSNFILLLQFFVVVVL